MTAPHTFVPGPDTTRAFRDALGQFATGVTVITTQTPDGPLGITANSFSSVSLDPPLVLWSPARNAGRFAVFEAARYFAVHIVGADQAGLASAFVRDGAAFDRLDWTHGASGAPLIEGCIARFECARHAVYDGGDHAIILGRVLSVSVAPRPPLLFVAGRFGVAAPEI